MKPNTNEEREVKYLILLKELMARWSRGMILA